ncbi:hypothetical protein DW846_01845 [Ruminococcus sp. AM36-2AA]|nr:hypothetical protein DW851_01840 [Ruminococcus sp. AM36-5]RGH62369.1 hypothetical protein DW846_01845 [Ruminococcus sp. AM36-2AA]
MTVEQANGNYNYMYEFRIGESWYPCHLLNISDDKLHGVIFARNGSVARDRLSNIRKMRKEDYLQNRKEVVEYLGKWAYNYGIHENIHDDLKLFDSVDDLMGS